MAPHKPSEKEDEYFLRMEAEKIKKFRSELDEKRDEEKKKHQKDATWMKCPKCGSDLEEISYQDVFIDKCSACEGLWLDHGELELLVSGDAHMTKGFLKKLFG